MNTRNTSYVQALRLKEMGLFLVGIWLIVLVAGIAASLYREIDGPTIRRLAAKNLDLNSIHTTLTEELRLANAANLEVNAELTHAKERITSLDTRLRISESASKR